MGTLISSHVCPNCRIRRVEWKVTGDGKLARGQKVKNGFIEDGGVAKARCDSCGESYEGTVRVDAHTKKFEGVLTKW